MSCCLQTPHTKSTNTNNWKMYREHVHKLWTTFAYVHMRLLQPSEILSEMSSSYQLLQVSHCYVRNLVAFQMCLCNESP